MFTDLEGSTALWDDRPDGMAVALARHDGIIRSTAPKHGGWIFSTGGDGFALAFSTTANAVAAAIDMQTKLAAETWPDGIPVKVRIGVHLGPAELRDGTYFGAEVTRTARICQVAHGAQVLLSAAAREQLVGNVSHWRLAPLGHRALKGFARPEALFQVIAEGLEPASPAQRSTREADVGNGALQISRFPLPRTSFVGRRSELAELTQLVESHRLVTVVGSGGVGKTRMAKELAARQAEPGRNEIHWIDLTPATGPGDVTEAFAKALDIHDVHGTDIVDQIVLRLRELSDLLVIDNCEHVIEEAAELIEYLLARTSDLRVLATSREPLHLTGEVLWRLPSLTTEATGSGLAEAVELFVERARLARPNFALTPEVQSAATSLCKQLDGVALAIELAAARLRHMPLSDLLAGLDTRFQLLRNASRAATGRQQTLEASIAWSYDLLDRTDKYALCALATIHGTFDVVIVSFVLGSEAVSATDCLGRLVDKSVVEFDDQGNYWLLETIRQFSLDSARSNGWLEGLRRRHLDLCVSLARQWRIDVDPPSLATLEEIERRSADLTSALRFSCGEDMEPAIELSAPLAVLALHQRRPSATSAWSEALLQRLRGSAPHGWCKVVAQLARARFDLGDVAFIQDEVSQAAEVATARGDVASRARCEAALGAVAFMLGDSDWSSRMRSAADMADTPALELDLRTWLGWSLAVNGQATEALLHLDRADEIGLVPRTGTEAQYRAARYIALMWQGEFTAADRELSDVDDVHHPLIVFATMLAALYTGSLRTAPIEFEHFHQPGFSQVVGHMLAAIEAVVYGRSPSTAADHAVEATRVTGNGDPPFPMVWLAATLALAASRPAAAQTFTDLAAENVATGGWGEVAVALLRTELAHQAGELEEASRYAHDGLRLATSLGLKAWVCDLLEAIAFIDLAGDRQERAATILGGVDAARSELEYRYRLPHRAALHGAAQALVGTDAWEAGARSSLDEVAALAQRMRGRRDRPVHGWSSLTPTEVAVVDCVRSGLSNPQIAERMFVSISTVKTHLEHIYAKLGVKNRIELVNRIPDRPTPT